MSHQPEGASPPDRKEWLAEVVVALLQRAQEQGLAEFAAERPPRIMPGLSVPEGQVCDSDCIRGCALLLCCSGKQ